MNPEAERFADTFVADDVARFVTVNCVVDDEPFNSTDGPENRAVIALSARGVCASARASGI